MGANCGRRALIAWPALEQPTRWTRAAVHRAIRYRWQLAFHYIIHLLRVRKAWARTGKLLQKASVKALTEHLTRKAGKLVYK